eukprot:439780-Rhodomonas_salina.1
MLAFVAAKLTYVGADFSKVDIPTRIKNAMQNYPQVRSALAKSCGLPVTGIACGSLSAYACGTRCP